MNKSVLIVPPGVKTPSIQYPIQPQLINRTLDPLSFSIDRYNTGQSQTLATRPLQPLVRTVQPQVLQPQVLQPLGQIAQPQVLQPQVLQPLGQIAQPQVLQPLGQTLQPQLLQPVQSQSQPQAIPIPGMISAPQIGLQNQKLRIEYYTPKSFIVRGNTMPHKNSFKMMKGRWINKPRDGGDPGWMFGNYNRPVVEAYVQSVNSGTTQSQALQSLARTVQPQVLQPLGQTVQPQVSQSFTPISQTQVLQPLGQTVQPQVSQSLSSISQPQVLQPLGQTVQSQTLQRLSQAQQMPVVRPQTLQLLSQAQQVPTLKRSTIDPTTGLVGYGNTHLSKNIGTSSQLLPLGGPTTSYQGLSSDQKLDMILVKLDKLLGVRQI
uniref:Uncharacterized protein n=1 Tax=Pithovirus LCPAC202 TaxID=2506592 RepID=A0A481Z5G3_9VIRU|nr:MAG: hypothetical protein LCPAC202_00720 [Pithovirus LCPAC202]